jgi:hypothetical protein
MPIKTRTPDNWKKEKSKRGVKYTYAEKIKALKVLEKNDFNYEHTERLLGVNAETIKGWAELHGKDVFKSRSKTIEAVDLDIQKRKEDFIDLAYDAKEKLIHRLLDLIPSETKILTLATVLESLQKCTMTEFGENNNEGLKPQNLYFQLNQQLLVMSKENEKTNKFTATGS